MLNYTATPAFELMRSMEDLGSGSRRCRILCGWPSHNLQPASSEGVAIAHLPNHVIKLKQ